MIVDPLQTFPPPPVAKRFAIRAMAGLECGVLAALGSEFFLLLFALLGGWGWPTWTAVALHIFTYGLAGIAATVFPRSWGWLRLAAFGLLIALIGQWALTRWVWPGLERIGPQQAGEWAHWCAAGGLGLILGLVPFRADAYERDFLLN